MCSGLHGVMRKPTEEVCQHLDRWSESDRTIILGESSPQLVLESLRDAMLGLALSGTDDILGLVPLHGDQRQTAGEARTRSVPRPDFQHVEQQDKAICRAPLDRVALRPQSLNDGGFNGFGCR